MRLKIFYAFLFIFVIITPRIINAVIMPDRNIMLNPLSHKTGSASLQFIPGAGGWVELDRFTGIAGDSDHSFDVMLGAAAELFRLGDDFDFTVSSDVELVATPDSPIYFNPRALFWQESFQFGAAPGSSFIHLGYVHRCRHDVDNIEVEDNTGERRELVLIYDSIFARWIPGAIIPGPSPRLPLLRRFYLRADLFVLKTDERSMVLPDKNINNLRTGLSAGIDTIVADTKMGLVYARFGCSVYSFADRWNISSAEYRELSADYSAEAGLLLPGAAGDLALFVNFSRQGMTMINPRNESRSFLSFGVRLRAGAMYN